MEGTPVVVNEGDHDLVDLPPGFRFHPTDEEIITQYLTEKVMDNMFTARAIGEVDLNKCEPWDLPKKAKMGEKEWFFFCQRDRKYPTGMRTNRATGSGYWKATGKDKEIYKGRGCLVGMKKTLVFYKGRAPKGEKTNWVIHEYRLEGKLSFYNFPKTAKDEWVVCRVFHKNTGIKGSPITGLIRMDSFVEDLLDSPSLPPLMDNDRPASSFTTDGKDEFRATTTASSARSSDGNYLSYFSTSMNVDRQLPKQEYHNNFLMPSNDCTHNTTFEACPSNLPPKSIFYSQIPLPSTPILPFKASPNLGYMHHERSCPTPSTSISSFPGSSVFKGTDQTILRGVAANHRTSELERRCKVEKFSSNHSVVSLSQDTGLSTDMTTEISSVVSKPEIASSTSYEDLEVPSSVGPIADLDAFWNY